MEQSLYRRWRPQRFDALVGQDAIRDTLQYALTHQQLCQAYLFCGPRGTGKTTTARLVAKLINCLASGDEVKPCNSCAACTSITEGANLDVLEIDAASNRGIDEIRQLREVVRFAPTQAKYKVFIIDEVHMLTREAFNALLKTLEEPPEHAVFILATTESQKIPLTIMSRCQRYDFRLATPDILARHLQTVAKEEGMNITQEAAAFVARLGEGSFRDALSLLEQLKTAGYDTYTQENTETFFGYVPEEQMEACLSAIIRSDTAEAYALIDALVARGSDIKAFCAQLLGLSQRGLEALSVGDFSGFSPAFGKVIQAESLARYVTWVERLIEANNRLKFSPIARLPLDVAIAKFAAETTSRPAPSKQPVLPKSEAATVAAIAPESTKATTPERAAPVAVGVIETTQVPVAVTMPNAIETEDWQKLLQGLKQDAPSLVTSLAHAKILGLEGETVKVAVPYKMHAEKINQVRNRQKVETLLHSITNSPWRVEAVVVKDLVVEEETADIADVFEFEEE